MAWLENRLYVGCLWAGALILLIAPAISLRFNNDVWLPKDHPQEIDLDYLAAQFAPGDDLVIALDLPDGFFNDDNLSRIARLERALEDRLGDDLISMRSPLSATRLADNQGVIEVESFDDARKRGAFKNLGDYARAFAASPYQGRLLAKDHQTAALDLRLDTREQAPRRARVIATVRAVLATQGWDGLYHFVGKAALKNRMNIITRADMPRLLAAAALMLAIFLWLALGRFSSAALVLAVAALAICGSLSVIVLLGHEMTVVALILPVMAGVIAVAHGLHILAHHRAVRAGENKNEAMITQATIKRVWRPCFFANLTTAIGFGSFALSGLIPLQNFGWDSIAMMIMLYAVVLAAFWTLFRFLGAGVGLDVQTKSYIFSDWLARFLTFCHHLTTKHPAKICLATVALVIFFAAGLVKFHTETNFLSVFFKPASQIRQDFALADRRLGGSGAMDVIIRHQQPDRFKKLDAFDQARLLGQKFNQQPKINYAEAMDIPVGLAHEAFTGDKTLPDNENKLAQELLFLELSRSEAKDDILSPYANFDYTATRIHLRTPDLGSGEIDALIAKITAIASAGDQIGEVILTGFNVFIHTLSTQILTTQMKSLALTGLLVFLIFVAMFGWHIGALGFASNLVPVASVLGVIAWSGTPFDFTTVLVAAITLGLAVDDSIHFLYGWRDARRAGMSAVAARAHALHLTGWAIILTSLLFCAGFAVFLVSELALLINFAIFTMIGLGLDLFSSIFFLPALLAFAGPHDIN